MITVLALIGAASLACWVAGFFRAWRAAYRRRRRQRRAIARRIRERNAFDAFQQNVRARIAEDMDVARLYKQIEVDPNTHIGRAVAGLRKPETIHDN